MLMYELGKGFQHSRSESLQLLRLYKDPVIISKKFFSKKTTTLLQLSFNMYGQNY